jgi:signal peptidase I
MIEGREHLIREMQEELFQKQGQGWFRIMSGSMRPLIDIDDKVLAKLVDPEEVKPGDIILFKNTDALVTHRVVKVIRHNGKTMILQRGDAGLELFSIVLQSLIFWVFGNLPILNQVITLWWLSIPDRILES